VRRGERRKFEHSTRRIPWLAEQRGEWNELRFELPDGDIVLTPTMTHKMLSIHLPVDMGECRHRFTKVRTLRTSTLLTAQIHQFQMAGSSAKFRHPSIMYVDVVARLENPNRKNSWPYYVGWRLTTSLFNGLTTLVHLVPRWVTILP